MAVLGCLIVTLCGSAESATAACTTPVHCHAVASWDTSGTYSGALAFITAQRLDLASGDHVLGALWVYPGSRDLDWVEQGISRNQVHGLHWYWAEANGCVFGGYQAHVTNLPTILGPNYASKISHNGLGKWASYRDGDFVGNSAACYTNTLGGADTGLETSSSTGANTALGTSSSLQKRGGSGVWSYNWGGATLDVDPGTSASWITQYSSLNWSSP